jgi:hypothetical protein
MSFYPHSTSFGRVNHLQLCPLGPTTSAFSPADHPVKARRTSPEVMPCIEEDHSLPTLHGLSDGSDSTSTASDTISREIDSGHPVFALELSGAETGAHLTGSSRAGDRNTVLAGLSWTTLNENRI